MSEIDTIYTVTITYFSSNYDDITESEKKGVTWYQLWINNKIVAEINSLHVVSIEYKQPNDGPIPF